MGTRPGSSERGAGVRRGGAALAAAVVLGLVLGVGGAQAASSPPAAVGRIVSARAVTAEPAPVAQTAAAAPRAHAGGAAAAVDMTAPRTEPAVAQTSASAHSAATRAATIAGFGFHPASLTVSVGDTITWTNDDAASHTVTADDGSFDTGRLGRGASGAHTFTAAGTFAYHCAIHPSMTGTVTVVAASSGGPGSGSGQAGQPSGSATGTTSAAPAPAASSAASRTLPRTGWDPAGMAVAGTALLLAGLALRLRTRPG